MHDNIGRALSYTRVHQVIRAGGGEEKNVEEAGATICWENVLRR